MVAQRDLDNIIEVMQEFRRKREEYLQAGERVKRLTGIDLIEGDEPIPDMPMGRISFKEAVNLVVHRNPQGLTPMQILDEVTRMGITTSSKSPNKMVSINLRELKIAGQVINRSGKWFPVSEQAE